MTTAIDPVVGAERFDPHRPEYLRDPYGHLADLRAEGPCWVDPGSGTWFLLSFDHVEAGLSQIVRGVGGGRSMREQFPGNPFAADGPGHAAPRRVIVPSLTNRSVQQYRARAQEIVDDVFTGRKRGGDVRVVEEIGFRLPYELTCDLLGIPDVDNRDELRRWTWQSLELIDAFLTPEQRQANLDAAACLAGHLQEVTAWKRDHLGDDLFSAVIQTADAGEVMRPEQVVPYVHTLYLAGMHTTVNQTALSLLAMLERRDQWELLVARPELLENAVEELLRFEPTAQYMRRTPDHDVDILGVTIPNGTEVVCWIASANRDPQRWGASADELDITREDARQHVAFGKGAHVCVGSWLARLELQVVVGTLLERHPGIELPEQELVWSSNFIRGPEELVVHLSEGSER
jgi:cytochrome P450